MTRPANATEFGWFGADSAVFGTATDDRDVGPSLGHDEAQHHPRHQSAVAGCGMIAVRLSSSHGTHV